ncbi:Panacea domain-containing protein [Weissella confusa]|uniref:Panacea domain-containing protein n=1 Tax=Weissella confusa TaxID=1583 RepID=UPI001436ABE0|nr:type II toxin-antitoxin system antitoxin SocA domain-containing protein [Weissella confusa]MBJ7633923.1 DUF4065 domain-containing protein [Weissella confusa]
MTNERNAYDAIDVANYVILKSKVFNDKITNLKLQKVLYFLQAAFLTEVHKSLIKEPFERWSYGPVVPEVYKFFRKFGSNQIKTPVSSYTIDITKGFEVTEEPFDQSVISDEDKRLIDKFYEPMAPYTAGRLVDLTHKQESWKKYTTNGKLNSDKIPPYSDKEIVESINENDEFKIW